MSDHTERTQADPQTTAGAHVAPGDVVARDFFVPLPGDDPIIDEDPPLPPDGGPPPPPPPPPPPLPANRTVTGQVRDQFNVPVSGVSVKAFQERLRTTRTQLGSTVQTRSGAEAGQYTITFSSPTAGFALVIEAQPGTGPVTKSAPFFNPPESVLVNLSLGGVYTGDSRFARLAAAVSQALGTGVAFASITPDDLPHLADKTGEDPERIAQLAAADRLAIAAGTLGVSVDQVQFRPVFFALVSAGLPPTLPDLLARGAEAHRHALRTAIDANLIQGMPDATLDTVVGTLDQLARVKSLENTPGALGSLPTVGALSAAAKSTLMGTFAKHRTDPAGFWAELATKPELTAAQRDKLRLNVQLNQLTRGHKALVDLVNSKTVNNQAAGTRPMDMKDLAGFTKGEWLTLLGEQQVPTPADKVPAWVPGPTLNARLGTFADLLQRQFEAAMPTAVVAGRAAKDATLPGKANVTAFLTNVAANNIPFEIGVTSVDKLRADSQQGPKAFAGLDAEVTARQLKAIQRVYKVALRYDPVSALLKDGRDSAYRMSQMGRKAFVARYAPSFGAGADGIREAEAAYRRAEQAVATTHALFSRYSAQLGNPGLPTLATQPDTVAGIPNWSTLFGSADFCECPECRSVFGPAAYLVDLLEFLRSRPAPTAAQPDRTAKDVLFARRPDLGTVELSCDNTTIAVLYVDLVNEILEGVVAAPIAHDRTTGTAEERAVSPEYLNEAAYAQLASQVFPWNLPFDLGRETARVFLAHLGVTRIELMEVFRPAEASPSGLVQEELLQEHLRLPTLEWRILTGADNRPPNQLWGLPATVNGASWVTVVANAREFLNRSGLVFDELTTLVATGFVEGLNNGTIAVARPAGGGSLDEITIAGLTDATLREIARFLRLRRALGWSIEDTDRAIRVLAHPQANRAIQLAAVHQLRAEVRRPLAEVLAWFGPLDTRADRPGEPSPYDKVFQNRATTNPVNPAFALNTARTELATPGGPVTAHTATLAATLGITAADLAALVPRRVPDVLNLANLSALYAHVSLASVLRVAVADLPALIGLTTFTLPFDRRFPDGVRAFLKRVQEIRGCGFGPRELGYLLAGQDRDASGIGSTDEDRAALLAELRAGLRQLAAEHADRPNLGRVAGQALAVQRLADALGLAEPVARRLATVTVRQPGGQLAAVSAFLDPAFVDTDAVDTLAYATALAGLDALERAAHLTRTLDLAADDLGFVFETGHGFSFDLNAPPPATSGGSLAGQMFRLLVTVGWIRLRNRFTPGSTRLFELFEAARSDPSSEALLAEIGAATGWNLADLQLVRGDLADEGDWPRIGRCFDLLDRLGVTAARAHAWAGSEITLAEARTIEQAAKARHDERSWLTVARPLRDRLRERQRAALAAAVQQAKGFADNDALYGHLLVDPEMSPCQMTSRIRLAISSVQLFVQRCLAGLEPQVTLDDEAAQAWEYLKRYRVWEANRKVFLYPESFLQPDLRKGKTPLFAELENRLLQDEITDQSVTDAFVAYADGLEQVARLDIRGAYHEIEERDGEQVDVLHVIARTFGAPSAYYYRQRVDSAYWTPWEKVDVDIEGNHLVPVVVNRRLFLYWPVFGQRTLPPDPDGNPCSQTTLKLAWTERKAGTWLAKRLTAGEWASKPGPAVDTRAIWFRAVVGDDELIVRFGTEHGPSGEFVQDSCRGDLIPRGYSEPVGFTRTLVVPPRTRLDAMGFVELPAVQVGAQPTTGYGPSRGRSGSPCAPAHGSGQLIAVPDPVPGRPNGTSAVPADDSLYLPVAQAARIGLPAAAKVLATTPGRFALLPLHQYPRFGSQDVFFYADASRTFLVTPRRAHRYDWSRPDRVDLGTAVAPATYFTAAGPALDRTVPFALSAPPPPAASAALSAVVATSVPGEATTVMRADQLTFPGVRKVDNLVTSFRRGHKILTETAPASPVVIPAGRADTVFTFTSLQHPYACEFLRRLHGGGVPELLGWATDAEATQLLYADFFATTYQPQADLVRGPVPTDEIDFSFGGTYSAYNWELFFHAPLLVADRLAANQRHADAQRWLHYLFDPINGPAGPAPQKFWKVKPLRDAAAGAALQDLQQMLGLLANPAGDAATQAAKAELCAQIEAWRRDPFDPDAVARLRVTAYQKAVVMRYVDNLVDWGDQLFRQDTAESVAEAAMLYLLAAALLGPKPVALPPASPPPVKSYNQLEATLDGFSNAIVALENLLPATPGEPEPVAGPSVPVTLLRNTLYFSIPPNEKLLRYWDTVADRLFKIRHCQNLDGVVRQLPLFDAPLDPELLARLRAAGVDLAAALDDTEVPLPTYRFQTLLAKAIEFTGDVRTLGGLLLSALQNRDAEQLAALRQTQEQAVLAALRQTRLDQVTEAEKNRESLTSAFDLAVLRRDHYQDLEFQNARERAQISNTHTALRYRVLGQLAQATAGLLHSGPDVEGGFFGLVPTASAKHGGSHLGHAASAAAAGLAALGDKSATEAAISGIKATFERRQEEWDLQIALAEKEITQIEAQQLAADARLAIARHEVDVHDLQTRQSAEVASFLHEKFTSRELYNWMVGQVAAVYFQAYQLAYELARKAERAFQHELAADTRFIEFGYWDNLKRGLLAGERLHADLRRMEAAYLDRNVRELEITKHVSLALTDPLALVALKRTGSCFVDLPESLFDGDFPGHYLRRIKSVALTIPCVTGPYTGVNATLTLKSSRVRHDPSVNNGYPRTEPDPRFADSLVPVQSIVTSSGQGDPGLFEANLRDERYLPFEGAGAISEWQLEIPPLTNRFDLRSISDVVLTLRYTARDGGLALRGAAAAEVAKAARTGAQFFSARRAFADAWHRFLHPAGNAASQALELDLRPERFPFQPGGEGTHITEVHLFLRVARLPSGSFSMELFDNSNASSPNLLAGKPLTATEGAYHVDVEFAAGRPHGSWLLRVQGQQIPADLVQPVAGTTAKRLDPDLIEDLYLVCTYGPA